MHCLDVPLQLEQTPAMATASVCSTQHSGDRCSDSFLGSTATLVLAVVMVAISTDLVQLRLSMSSGFAFEIKPAAVGFAVLGVAATFLLKLRRPTYHAEGLIAQSSEPISNNGSTANKGSIGQVKTSTVLPNLSSFGTRLPPHLARVPTPCKFASRLPPSLARASSKSASPAIQSSTIPKGSPSNVTLPPALPQAIPTWDSHRSRNHQGQDQSIHLGSKTEARSFASSKASSNSDGSTLGSDCPPLGVDPAQALRLSLAALPRRRPPPTAPPLPELPSVPAQQDGPAPPVALLPPSPLAHLKKPLTWADTAPDKSERHDSNSKSYTTTNGHSSNASISSNNSTSAEHDTSILKTCCTCSCSNNSTCNSSRQGTDLRKKLGDCSSASETGQCLNAGLASTSHRDNACSSGGNPLSCTTAVQTSAAHTPVRSMYGPDHRHHVLEELIALAAAVPLPPSPSSLSSTSDDDTESQDFKHGDTCCITELGAHSHMQRGNGGMPCMIQIARQELSPSTQDVLSIHDDQQSGYTEVRKFACKGELLRVMRAHQMASPNLSPLRPSRVREIQNQLISDELLQSDLKGAGI